MNAQQRREKIIEILSKSEKPVSGSKIAKELSVSRQVIVQDIALLRAENHIIVSTTMGYSMIKHGACSRVFKVIHSDDDAPKELQIIIDYGGTVKDVFVYHKVYGIVKAEMNIRTKLDINNYIEDIKSGKSSLLKNITSGYHYHTVIADNVALLDLIEDELWKAGFLAELQDHEPVDFANQ